MKQSVILTITSVLSIILSMCHLTDDIARGISPGKLSNLPVILFWVIWLYGTLMLAERRSGYVIVLVASLLASALPVIHMMGKGVGTIAKSSGGFFFVWTLFAVGVTAFFSVILSARGLWSLRRARPQ